jgi:hypothetical protein
MKKKDEKGLAGEVLPAPDRRDVAAGKPSPRERAAAHLSKVLAAAAGLAIAPAALADVTPPPGGSKTGDKKPEDKPKSGDAQPKKQPEPPGYGVVDPIPQPPPDAGKPGFLKLDSKPSGLAIQLDGRDLNLKTPQKKIKLPPGMHTITLTSPDKSISQNFTVEIEAGKTQSQTFDATPTPPPKTPQK